MTTMNRMNTTSGPGLATMPPFPYASPEWSKQSAQTMAQAEGVELSDDHWEAVRALQEYFARHEPRAHNLRELHDALEERFHTRGGMRYVYKLFPGGPLAQGCRIAGLAVPFLAVDRGFGSVM